MKRTLSVVLVVLLLITALPISSLAAVAEESKSYLALPGKLTKVEDEAFAGNTSIRTVVVPNAVESIGSAAFAGCSNITEVTITSREIAIADDAFKDCSKDIVFYAYAGSKAERWALVHGYKCETLSEGPEQVAQFADFIAYGGLEMSMLQGNFGTKRLIIRTTDEKLPDISQYRPSYVFKSNDNLYFVQFEDEINTELCYNALDEAGYEVEPDMIIEFNSFTAQGVTMADNWASADEMGFDTYAPYVAAHASGNVTIAVIDSGLNSGVWQGKVSSNSVSLIDRNLNSDAVQHGSKVASIIGDCLGDNVSHVTLLPIKVTNSSSQCCTSMIIEALRRAIDGGADIINMSLGWDRLDGLSPEIENQIGIAGSKGITVVAAAGNGSGSTMYPAAYSGVLAVSAVTYSNESKLYSVASRTGGIAYTAPGLHLSTKAYSKLTSVNDRTQRASTSYATPQITAALALIKLDATHSGSATEVLNSCCDDLSGSGLVSSEVGNGLPRLDRLTKVGTQDITLSNLSGGDVPTRLWLGASGQDEAQIAWTLVPSDASDKLVTVSSSNEAVIRCDQSDNTSVKLTAVGVGEANISFTNGSFTKTHKIIVEQPVTGITITGASELLKKPDGEEQNVLQLAAAVQPANATNPALSWSSSNEAVATVSQSGVVTPVKAGNVTITCEAKDTFGTKASKQITVVDQPDPVSVAILVKERAIENNKISMTPNETLTIKTQVLPEKASQTVYISAYPTDVVSVEDGVLTAKATGTATVVAAAAAGKNITSYLTVNVVAYPESIQVSADKQTLDIGEVTAVSAQLLPADATATKVSWYSKNTTVASINSSTGIVTAIAAGTASIVGTTENGLTASVDITVRKPITIKLDANGGSCDESSLSAYAGYAIGALPEASREYQTFKGWYTQAGAKASSGSIYKESLTLYAHWEGMSFNVTFDANTGSCDTTSMTGKVGEKLGALPTPTKTNYSFKGWFTAAEGGSEVNADYVHQTTTELKLYAQWTSNPYIMYFVANGGTCEVSSKNGAVDSPIGALPTPTKANYTFAGWYTELEGGTQITESYTRSSMTPVYVYAHWTPNTYTMTFDATPGKCDTTSKTCTVDADVGTLPTPTLDAYDFMGWYTSDGTHVTSLYSQSAANDITVQAHWSAKTYTVTFDANGGICDKATVIGTVGAAIGALPTPTREYHYFDGWYAGDTKVDAAYTQSTTEAVTFTAHWTAMTYTVTFMDRETEFAVYEFPVGTAIGSELSGLSQPQRSGYGFNGWYTKENGGTKITESFVQKTTDPLTVYAQWSASSYTITLNANGGTCAASSLTGTVDQAIGTLPTPTRNYYDFDGWYTSAEGGTQVTGAYVQTKADPLTIYAHWTAKTYVMKFDANGGNLSGDDETGTFTVSKEIGDISLLPTPTRASYTFDGWYTAADGGTKITASYTHLTTDTVTVYAHWTPNTYSMKFDANGGSCSTTSMTCTVDKAIGTLPTPTRDYYTFTGWKTSNGTSVTSNSYKQSTATNVTVIAQWTENAWSSDWVTSVPSNARSVATKTQYQYRDLQYSSWSGWSDWTTTRESTSDLKKEDTATVYGWYWFQCPNCGAHWHVWAGLSVDCSKTWGPGGGCGNDNIQSTDWHVVWNTTPWSSGTQNWQGTGRVCLGSNIYTRMFAWKDGGSARTGYRYATRTSSWGSWSSWSDSSYSASSTRQINTRTLYRYQLK